jgi:uncharacterized membrane protein YdjX (TVP38/TMEM64 family)
MKTFHKKLLVWITLLVIAIFILYYFGISQHLSLESVKSNASYLQDKVTENYFHAALVFIAVSTLLIMLTFPITAPMAVLGGFLFGMGPGILYSMISIIIGTAISFLVVRYALSHMMKHKYGERLAGFNERMQKYGYTYLITLQLLTVVPYFIINSLAALAGVPFFMFLLTTIVGSFPIVVIYAFAGKQLYNIHSWQDILSTQMLLVLLLLAALALLPMFIQKWRLRNGGDSDAF